MKKNTLTLAFLFLFLFSTFNSSVSVYANAPKESIPKSSSSSTVFRFDGKVTSGEWNENHTIAFLLDVDNDEGDLTPNPPNKDGENYLYLGQDNKSLFLAFDFASDNTSDDAGEWFGVWLNVANRSFNDNQGWHDHIDNGTESVIFDVDNNKEWEYFHPSNTEQLDLRFTSDSEYAVTRGTKVGDYLALEYDEDLYLNITSQNFGREYYWVNFSLNVTKLFTIFPDLYINGLLDFEFSFTYDLNVTINEHKLIVWNPDGSFPGLNHPEQVILIDNNAGEKTITKDIGIGNKTSGHLIQFSLFGNHSAQFKNSIDRLFIDVLHRKEDSPTSGSGFSAWCKYPYSSINTYAIAWSFGSSPTNATTHRMYEMIIPLSELEGYNKTTHELGISIGGYGTFLSQI